MRADPGSPHDLAALGGPDGPRFPSRLAPADSLMWEMERDPVLRSPILVLALLDGQPDPARLHAAFARATALVPRLHQTVDRAPLGGHRWVDAPDVDLSSHLRRVRAPDPATLRTVLDLAQSVLSDGFDRQRPLWEAHLVEGLDDDRAALLLKVHHSITDGVGGVALAGALFDPSADPPRAETRPARTGDDTWARRGRALIDAATLPWRALPGVVRSVTDPLGATRDAARTAASLGRLLAPARTPLSPLLRGRGLVHRLDALEVPLAELAAAAHLVDGTINDAFLAGLVGGLQRYHEAHGAPVRALRVTMPVDLRREDDPLGGNHFAPLRLTLPTDVADPLERIRAIGALAHEGRDDPSLRWTATMARGLLALPPPFATVALGGMFKAVDLDAVDVPGVPGPVWLAGVPVERMFAFAPPTGAALSATLLSHGDQATIGVQTDRRAVPDPDVLGRHLRDGIEEVRSVGAGPRRRVRGAR